MPTTYYLRVNVAHESWEEVDPFIFENRDKCLLGESQRYSGDYVIRYEDGTAKIHISNGEPTTMVVGLRLGGINKLVVDNLMTMATKDLLKKPEMIKFKVNKKITKVHENFSVTNLPVG